MVKLGPAPQLTEHVEKDSNSTFGKSTFGKSGAKRGFTPPCGAKTIITFLLDFYKLYLRISNRFGYTYN